MPSKRTLSPWIRALVIAVCLVVPGSISEEELECEEAFAHVESCCGTLGMPPVCGDGAGCNSLILSLEESTCLQERDCDELRAAGICERVRALSPGSPEDEPREEVCP